MAGAGLTIKNDQLVLFFGQLSGKFVEFPGGYRNRPGDVSFIIAEKRPRIYKLKTSFFRPQRYESGNFIHRDYLLLSNLCRCSYFQFLRNVHCRDRSAEKEKSCCNSRSKDSSSALACHTRSFNKSIRTLE